MIKMHCALLEKMGTGITCGEMSKGILFVGGQTRRGVYGVMCLLGKGSGKVGEWRVARRNIAHNATLMRVKCFLTSGGWIGD